MWQSRAARWGQVAVRGGRHDGLLCGDAVRALLILVRTAALALIGLVLGAYLYLGMFRGEGTGLHFEYLGTGAAIRFVAIATLVETVAIRGILASAGVRWEPEWQPWLASSVIALMVCLLALFGGSPWD